MIPAIGCTAATAAAVALWLLLAAGVLYASGHNPGVVLVVAGALALYSILILTGGKTR